MVPNVVVAMFVEFYILLEFTVSPNNNHISDKVINNNAEREKKR